MRLDRETVSEKARGGVLLATDERSGSQHVSGNIVSVTAIQHKLANISDMQRSRSTHAMELISAHCLHRGDLREKSWRVACGLEHPVAVTGLAPREQRAERMAGSLAEPSRLSGKKAPQGER